MKNTLFFSIFFLLIFQVIDANNLRIVSSINASWKFSRNDYPNALNENFNDASWELVSIPHTWNREDADDEIPGYYRGIGWYRRMIIIPAEREGKQVYISFDGVNQETEIFVNGKPVGKHDGGYTRFCLDITGFVKFGKTNLIAVKVNNRYNANIPPLSADFTFFGGIYRDVNLIFTAKQHISTTFYASSGIFITTPTVSDKEADVNIKTLVVNNDSLPAKVRVENCILSPSGIQINTTSILTSIRPNSTVPVEQKN